MLVQDRISVSDEALAELCRRYYVRELALFGSVLRDDFRDDSDIDMLVEFEPGARIGLLAFIGLKEDLSDLLNRDVDLVEKAGLKRLIRDRVLGTARVVYHVDGQAPLVSTAVPIDGGKTPTRHERDALNLETLDDACTLIAGYVVNRDPLKLEDDDVRRSAILFELYRVSVAIDRLSSALKEYYSEIPWQLVRDAGADAVEQHGEIDWERYSRIVTVTIPTLQHSVVAILSAEPSDDTSS